MPRATIIAQVDLPEVEVLERWLGIWELHLDCSENLGCGCCVNIFNVEGPQEALDELPKRMLANSEWANPGRSA